MGAANRGKKRDGERQRRRKAAGGEIYQRRRQEGERRWKETRGKAKERDRGRRGVSEEGREGRERDRGAKQEGDRKSSPTVCRLPADAHSWIVLPVRLTRTGGWEVCIRPHLPHLRGAAALFSFSADINTHFPCLAHIRSCSFNTHTVSNWCDLNPAVRCGGGNSCLILCIFKSK